MSRGAPGLSGTQFQDHCSRMHDAIRLGIEALSFVRCLETFCCIFAVTLSLVRSNSWDAQLAVPNDPRYARLETNLGIRLAKEG
ncbi:hypothetical protein TNCV_3897461 [Trichonephila clavipes]|nr:hypothetical protein TNCV_3897461 [Trichonephila clavipes]